MTQQDLVCGVRRIRPNERFYQQSLCFKQFIQDDTLRIYPGFFLGIGIIHYRYPCWHISSLAIYQISKQVVREIEKVR